MSGLVDVQDDFRVSYDGVQGPPFAQAGRETSENSSHNDEAPVLKDLSGISDGMLISTTAVGHVNEKPHRAVHSALPELRVHYVVLAFFQKLHSAFSKNKNKSTEFQTVKESKSFESIETNGSSNMAGLR